MTAWTAVIVLVGISTKCVLDMIGLEYQSHNQAITDDQFSRIMSFCVFAGMIVDSCNFARRRVSK